MNEGIRLKLKIDGNDTQAVALNQDGVVFDSETSAPPRGFTFILNPGNPITEFRLQRVRQIQDWQPGEFHANLKADAGGFLCTGVDSLSLPAGRYDVGLEIADLISKPTMIGYMNGLALTILVGQLPKLFGFSVDADGFIPELKGFVNGVADGGQNRTRLKQNRVAGLPMGVDPLAILGERSVEAAQEAGRVHRDVADELGATNPAHPSRRAGLQVHQVED
jgi:hypothetical protein